MQISKKPKESNHWFPESFKETKGSFVHLHNFSGVQFKAMTAFVYLKGFLMPASVIMC